MAYTKYIINCQKCKESLRIEYGTGQNPPAEEKIHKHLRELMAEHYKDPPEPIVHPRPINADEAISEANALPIEKKQELLA